MRKSCAACGSTCECNDVKALAPAALYFDAINCIKEWVEAQHVDYITKNLFLQSQTHYFKGDQGACYSTMLGKYFRSWYEVMVAEVMAGSWNWMVLYEPSQFKLDDGSVYIPDFYLPEYGVWLEVKGLWERGARAKFNKALSLLTPERLLLIPSMFYHKFAKAARGYSRAKGNFFPTRIRT